MKRTRIFAIVLAVLMLCVTFAFAASAYSSVSGPSDTDTTHPIGLTKYLILDEDAPIPTIDFTFNIGASKPTNDEKGVLNGILPTVTTVTIPYSSIDSGEKITDITKFNGPGGVAASVGTVAYKKSVNFDFSSAEFEKPGVYKYEVSEVIGGVPGMTYDTEHYFVYLYVGFEKDESNSFNYEALKILNVTTWLKTDTGTVKSDGVTFPNQAASYDLTVSKTVTGNLGDTERYFEFNLEMNAAAMANSTIKIDLKNATAGEKAITYYASATSSEEEKTNEETCTADANGKFTYTFYLKSGQSITVQSLPKGITYTIKETSYTDDGYKTQLKTTVKADTEDTEDSVTDSTTNTHESASLLNDTIEAFTNTYDKIDTGVMLEKLPFIAMAIIALGGISFMLVSKKRKNEE